MVLKIYLNFVLFFSIFNLYYKYFITKASLNIVELIQLGVQTLLIIGLFSFIYNKKIFSQKNWKIILILGVAQLIFQSLKTLIQGSVYTVVGIQELLIGMLAFLILDFPAYYSVYKLGEVNLPIKKKSKKR